MVRIKKVQVKHKQLVGLAHPNPVVKKLKQRLRTVNLYFYMQEEFFTKKKQIAVIAKQLGIN